MTYPTSMTELTDSVPSSGAAATTTLGNATYQHATWHRSAAAEIEAISGDLITARGSYASMAARIAKPSITDDNEADAIHIGSWSCFAPEVGKKAPKIRRRSK